MAIDPQPAMTPLYLRARPTRPPHGLVLVMRPPRSWTMTKIVGLLALTIAGVALTLTVVIGGAWFAIVNIG